MADSFEDVLAGLMKRCPAVAAVGFMDIDGAEIAFLPKQAQERLKGGAAFGGIALRRLAAAEKAAGRGGVRHLDIAGHEGRLLAFSVGTEYQLIVLLGDGQAPGVVGAAEEAVGLLEAGI